MQCLSARKQKRLFSSSNASLQPSAMNFCMSICRDDTVSIYCWQRSEVSMQVEGSRIDLWRLEAEGWQGPSVLTQSFVITCTSPSGPVEKSVSSHFNSRSTAPHWQRPPSASHFSPIVPPPHLSFSSGSAQGSLRCVLKHKWRIKSTYAACELDLQFKAYLWNKPCFHSINKTPCRGYYLSFVVPIQHIVFYLISTYSTC